MQIVLLKVFCWKRIVHKCKWLSFRDNEFHFDQNENAFKVNECQRMVLFIFWLFWMLTHMQMLFLNVPYAQMKVILVLMRVYWPQWNKFGYKWMSIFYKWRAKGVVNLRIGSYVELLQCRIKFDRNSLPQVRLVLSHYPTEMQHRLRRRISAVSNLMHTLCIEHA